MSSKKLAITHAILFGLFAGGIFFIDDDFRIVVTVISLVLSILIFSRYGAMTGALYTFALYAEVTALFLLLKFLIYPGQESLGWIVLGMLYMGWIPLIAVPVLSFIAH